VGGHDGEEPEIFVRNGIRVNIFRQYLLFLMEGGRGVGLARNESVVSNIIVTGRPSLARKAAELEAFVRSYLDARPIEPTLLPTSHRQ
jgi:hypothetical protein